MLLLKSNFLTFKWLIQFKWYTYIHTHAYVSSYSIYNDEEKNKCNKMISQSSKTVLFSKQILAFTAQYSECHNSPTLFITLFIHTVKLTWQTQHTLSFFLSLKLPATFSLSLSTKWLQRLFITGANTPVTGARRTECLVLPTSAPRFSQQPPLLLPVAGIQLLPPPCRLLDCLPLVSRRRIVAILRALLILRNSNLLLLLVLVLIFILLFWIIIGWKLKISYYFCFL